ncbi:MAG: DUF4911 domain-containing protein [Mariprofundaceae bacterium]
MQPHSDVVIVEVDLPPQKVVLFQALLSGEEGLAVARCRDPAKCRQQLWTTVSRRYALYDWLASLPESLKPVVMSEHLWQGHQYG